MKFVMKIPRFLEFIIIYIWKILQSNIYVASRVIRPRLKFSPSILEVPIHLKKKSSTLVFFNLVTMTPGTLSMELGKGRKSIFIHAMDLKSEEKFKKELLQLENKVKFLFD